MRGGSLFRRHLFSPSGLFPRGRVPPTAGAAGKQVISVYLRPGPLTIIPYWAARWREHSGAVAASAERLHESLKKAIIEAAADRPTPSATLDIDSIGRETLGHLARRFDRQHGGFGGAPKFPTPSTLVFLLEVAKAANLKDTSLASMGPEARQQALSMVGKTLEAIWRGGIHDHVGTGIHRYSVDQAWHLPQ